MTTWTTEPQHGERRHATTLLRTSPAKPNVGIITSKIMVGTYVHFWKGRTTPCEEENCPACKDHRTARWYGWFGLWSPRTREHVIAEVTAACVDAINTYQTNNGQLRGALIDIRRTNNKPNSRLTVRIEQAAMSPEVLPPELNVIETLLHIWETHKTRSPIASETPIVPVEQELANQLRLHA